MSRVTYDTNVLIRFRPAHYPAGFFMSAVVVQELTAGAKDAAHMQVFEQLWRDFEARDRLLVPNGEDWWFTGKILSSLRRGLRSHRAGRTSAISAEEQQRIVRDVLIARSAKRINAVVVTENVADFEKIRRFCNVRIVRPAHYF